MLSKTRVPLFIALVTIIIATPFLFTLAGDAQVHLAIADNFANGYPFQYNPNGEIVVASTSPFWTILLTTLFLFVGSATPLFLKIITTAIWLGTAYLIYRIAKDVWDWSDGWVWCVMGLWLAHATIVANALNGLENVLSAFQLVWLYYLACQWHNYLTTKRAVALGLLLGWMWLTRPDGGLFGLGVVGLMGVWQVVYGLGKRGTADWGGWLRRWVLVGICAGIILVPWYVYQGEIAGNFVTDSSIARLYTGRQGAIPLIADQLYFHPKATISLATAFLPLLIGWAIFPVGAWVRSEQSVRQTVANLYFPTITAWLLVLAGWIFYTFVVGAEAFGRYFLPLYPFLFMTGMVGWWGVIAGIFSYQKPKHRQLALIATLSFLALTSGLDYVRRVSNPHATATALDVIYGPAHGQYFAYNLSPLLKAPPNRRTITDEFLQMLGDSHSMPVKIAVTEVQLRYYLDERVEILSLDGRTSADILDYFDETTGVPDFPRYFAKEQPDYVHVNQWCAVGGWLAGLFTSSIEDNLVCAWQKQTENMAIGESFVWEGRSVTLVAPEIVRIDW
jgi:hypothetical protein